MLLQNLPPTPSQTQVISPPHHLNLVTYYISISNISLSPIVPARDFRYLLPVRIEPFQVVLLRIGNLEHTTRKHYVLAHCLGDRVLIGRDLQALGGYRA